MNISSMKNIIGVFGIGFLMLGSFSFGQSCPNGDADCPIDYDCINGFCMNTSSVKYTPPVVDEHLQTAEEKAAADAAAASKVKCDGGTVIGGMICQCPDNTKNIDGVCKSCTEEGVCCGVQLNTNVPFIGNCIELSKSSTESADPNQTTVTEQTAFPTLMGGLTKIMVTVIILMGFIGILAGGVMISAAGSDDGKAGEGKKLIGKVIMALALLGASGVILRLINPNFFG